MSHICWRLHLGAVLAVGGAFVTTSIESSLAQSITVDGTLGSTQTINGPNYTIPQSVGQTVGSNLFHSFGRFSLNTSESAVFQSAGEIRNILSRVTGGLPSRIDGLIRTDSNNVNLFLINPSGIVFGPNARLDVGGSTRGSFIATTADAIVWGNNSQFSATNPGGVNSLLTIVGDPSGFLFNRPPQAIAVNGSELSVDQSQSLLLLGGKINLNNSLLEVDSSVGGQIELGSVGAPGKVGITTQGNILNLDFPRNLVRADVSLRNNAQVNVFAEVGGSINVNTHNLNLEGGSHIQVAIPEGSGDINSRTGDINVNATGNIHLQQRSMISTAVAINATGNAGNINIVTNSLLAADGSQVNASSFGIGDGGSISITAGDAVAFDGVASDGLISSAISYIDAGAEGNGGIVTINARSLTLTNGGQVSASVRSATNTLPGGQGNAGNVNVNVRDAIIINDANSGVLSLLGVGAVGRGGNIEINTGSLTVTNGGQVNASSFGIGDGGNISITAGDTVAFDGVASNGLISSAISYIDAGAEGNGGIVTINARSLTLTNGGQVSASVRSATDSLPGGRGNAGNVNINVSDTTTITGRSANATNSGILSLVGVGAVGNGGNVNLDTENLTLRDNAELTVSNRGIGNAGNIRANAGNIVLDNQGQITATSLSGQGGNISLQVRDILLLRRNSFISHISGTPEAGGTGGNFLANAGFIVAVPSENSDIITNAFNGSGGNIIINAQNIFGLQFQPQLTLGSDIVATGTVTLNTPNIDPVQSLAYLPTTVDAPEPIGQSCRNNQTGSQFNVTGRGGLPGSPDESLSGDVVWSDTRLTVAAKPQHNPTIPGTQKQSNIADHLAIVPATGWVRDRQGKVTLVAHSPNISNSNVGYLGTHCQIPQPD
ncbi:filamentous hemagglutinin N-terminal domain-containing protein [Nostoc sp. PCC 7107]|uniref:two-partner secretion domain-containing protein n=1 Tax=Nostoc sp. PCC 7107 TaxID=317936 RepID=UPI00029F1FA9|nr:filamentous hemagglutinin N-terminal domain-containing protein [Nostoc sp. PCC 7107]AFY41519.1 filamentous hemagglutinin family outer membrane protein [Nostoc sp. PCC 7107]